MDDKGNSAPTSTENQANYGNVDDMWDLYTTEISRLETYVDQCIANREDNPGRYDQQIELAKRHIGTFNQSLQNLLNRIDRIDSMNKPVAPETTTAEPAPQTGVDADSVGEDQKPVGFISPDGLVSFDPETAKDDKEAFGDNLTRNVS